MHGAELAARFRLALLSLPEQTSNLVGGNTSDVYARWNCCSFLLFNLHFFKRSQSRCTTTTNVYHPTRRERGHGSSSVFRGTSAFWQPRLQRFVIGGNMAGRARKRNRSCVERNMSSHERYGDTSRSFRPQTSSSSTFLTQRNCENLTEGH